MGVLQSIGIGALLDPSTPEGTPIDILIQMIGLPALVGLVFVIFIASYFLTGGNSSKFGVSSKSVASFKQLSMNFLIVIFGAMFFSFMIWQAYYPIPYWGDQTALITTIGILFGVSFGFLTFYGIYRRQGQ
jgi:hypothetical protein